MKRLLFILIFLVPFVGWSQNTIRIKVKRFEGHRSLSEIQNLYSGSICRNARLSIPLDYNESVFTRCNEKSNRTIEYIYDSNNKIRTRINPDGRIYHLNYDRLPSFQEKVFGVFSSIWEALVDIHLAVILAVGMFVALKGKTSWYY